MTLNIDFLTNFGESIQSSINSNIQNMTRYEAQKSIINGYNGPNSANCYGSTIISKMNEKYGFTNSSLNLIEITSKEVLILLNNKPLFKTKKLFWEIEPTENFFNELENAMLLYKLDILFEGEPK